MSDQRRKLRKDLMAFTLVYGLHPRTLFGHIEDLTVQGALVIGEAPVEVNKQLTLEIEFPGDLPELTAPRITVPARAAWCKPEKEPHYFSIGFEFTALKPEDEKIIVAISRRYEFRREIPAGDVE
jgi:hypothetical protein